MATLCCLQTDIRPFIRTPNRPNFRLSDLAPHHLLDRHAPVAAGKRLICRLRRAVQVMEATRHPIVFQTQ